MRGHNVCFYGEIRLIVPVTPCYLKHCKFHVLSFPNYTCVSVPIHVELCVIHADILTIAHVLSTTHVHLRTFFRAEKRYFHRTILLGLLF